MFVLTKNLFFPFFKFQQQDKLLQPGIYSKGLTKRKQTVIPKILFLCFILYIMYVLSIFIIQSFSNSQSSRNKPTQHTGTQTQVFLNTKRSVRHPLTTFSPFHCHISCLIFFSFFLVLISCHIFYLFSCCIFL